MSSWAFIYEHPNADPDADRSVLDRDGQRSIMVPIADPADAADVAEKLVADGVELIELCGGLPLMAAAQVVERVGDTVPVGHVTFSVETVEAAAAYTAKFTASAAEAG